MSQIETAVSMLKNRRAAIQQELTKITQALGVLEGSGSPPTKPDRKLRRRPVSTMPAVKPKHSISAAGMRRIKAAQRARWAKFRTAKAAKAKA